MKLCGGGGGARAQPATASPAPSRGSRPLPVPRQPPPPLLWGTRETLGDGWGVNGSVRGPGHLWEKAPGRSGRQAGSGQLTSGEGSQREQAAAKRGRDTPTPGPAAVRGGRPPLGTPRASAKLRSARREGSGGKARRGGRCLSPPTADLGSFPPPGWGGGGRWDPEPSATMVSAPARAGEARRGATPGGVAINADPHRCSEVVGLCQRLNRRQLPGTGRRGGAAAIFLAVPVTTLPCQAQRAGERAAGQEAPRWPSPERDTFQEFLFILSQPWGLAEERGEGGSRPPAPDRSPGRRRRPVALRRFWPRPFPPGCGTGEPLSLFICFYHHQQLFY